MGNAKWIQAPWSTVRDGAEADGSRPMPVFRREFVLREKPKNAVLRIVGLGQWQASIGYAGHVEAVEHGGLHGDWTDYRKTIAFDAVNVTSMVGRGRNVLAVMLGNGMYNVQRTALPGVPPRGMRYTKFAAAFGPPKMIAELDVEYADGSRETLATDAQWKVDRGPVMFDSTYGGEDYDARREQEGWKLPGFDDKGWITAEVVAGPGGELIPAIAPRVGQHERYQPVKQTDVGSGRAVYDLGQNFAGIVQVKVKGPAGAILRLTPGELLNPDGTVSQATFHGPMWWSYTLRGDTAGETWEPLFGYGGFRYVQAEWTPGPGMIATKLNSVPPKGQLLSVFGIAEHSDAQAVGSFASSSEMLNRIHKLIVEAMHNNEVSILTDCPHREKLGWLEQTHLQATGLMFNNDMKKMFAALDRNMSDEQLANGIVPTIAPQYTHFGPKNAIFDDSPEWGSASVLEPWWAYRFYGDKAQLQRDYPMMRRYVAALQSKAVDGIVAYGLGDWYDIGPGSPGFEKNTSLGVTGTLMLYEDAVAMNHVAKLLGHTEDAAAYEALAKATADAFNRRFWNADHGWYDTGSQTANAMPVALGVVPLDKRAAVLQHVVDDIHAHQDHVTAGEIGYPYLLRALAEGGRDDVILAMMLRKDPPSYGSQLAAGATALTEAWDANPHSSQDHFMLGSAEEWFYRRLGGMDIDLSREDKAEQLTVRPIAVKGVDWVRCGYDSALGKVESDWRRAGVKVLYRVTVPKEATVVLPSGATAESKRAVLLLSRDEEEIFRVGPGTWNFSAPK
ncbi:MAG TPA: family 78 glycoside hydrolase catalytic domain [Bryocella sp.]|nr:family 78 glycoside hydrolase catalytic domain [Bryocella sp.]